MSLQGQIPAIPQRDNQLAAGSERVAIQPVSIDSAIRQWMQILLKWKWVIAATIAVAVILGIIATLLITRMYTASVTLEIAREEANVVNIEGVEPQIGSLDQEFYQTQYGLLKSRSLAEQVARELNLQKSPQFFAMFDETDAAGFEDGLQGGSDKSQEAKRVRIAAELLLENIAVSPERASRLVVLGFESPDAEFSAKVANVWAEKFIESNLERRFEATSYARDFLEGRLAETRQRLEASERELVNYAAANDLVTIEDPAQSEPGVTTQRSIVTDDLLSLNEQLARARGARIATESRFRNSGAGDSSAESLANPALATLRQRRAEAAADYARMMAQFAPEYPPAQALKAQIDQFDASIAREESRVRQSLRNAFQDAAAAESRLQDQVDQLQGEVIDQRRRGIQFNIYQREVDTNRQLYNALLQRYKEIGVAGGIGTNNVAVVDRAIPPEKPSQPRPLLNLLISLLAGGVLGIALAFILEQIDEAISDPGQLEKDLGVASLGTVPAVDDEEPLVALQDRKSEMSEAYLSVETALRFSTPEGLPRSLLVTSTQPAEGKSTSSLALAMTLARLGRNTLLIDADMRSPSVDGLLDLSNKKGLSDVLAGQSGLQETTQASTLEHLRILTAGQMPPSAAELLSGRNFDQMLETALQHFDNVVIDAPPVMGLADAPLIASKAAGTVMIVEANRTRARQASLALKRLQAANANLLGAVLTKFSSKRAHYGYGYEYGYGYGEDRRSEESVG